MNRSSPELAQRAHHAVDPQAHLGAARLVLDVEVAGALLQGIEQQRVQQLHRAAVGGAQAGQGQLAGLVVALIKGIAGITR